MRSPFLKWLVGGTLAAALAMGGGLPSLAARPSAAPAPEAAQTQQQDGQAGGGSSAAGTVLLLGAGAYTCLRLKGRQTKEERPAPHYEYFENHTRTGTLRPHERAQQEGKDLL